MGRAAGLVVGKVDLCLQPTCGTGRRRGWVVGAVVKRGLTGHWLHIALITGDVNVYVCLQPTRGT